MKALTLWQPWAWAVAAGHKPIENRPWPPPARAIGSRIAIHAGRRWDDAGALAISRNLGELADLPAMHVRGAVIGVATIQFCFMSNDIISDLGDDQRRWFTGPYGWFLTDVIQLERPVPCRGFQKLWSLPSAVEAEVLRQLSATASTV